MWRKALLTCVCITRCISPIALILELFFLDALNLRLIDVEIRTTTIFFKEVVRKPRYSHWILVSHSFEWRLPMGQLTMLLHLHLYPNSLMGDNKYASVWWILVYHSLYRCDLSRYRIQLVVSIADARLTTYIFQNKTHKKYCGESTDCLTSLGLIHVCFYL